MYGSLGLVYSFLSYIPRFRIMDRAKHHNFFYPSCMLSFWLRVGIETYCISRRDFTKKCGFYTTWGNHYF
ncbi:hypothetical protein J1N35_029016 [Gossypium stocksii]|uniref:Uncharacterized protein n=1 Tax=Gossypium stocksii TaxID=47602 RepID=A0A9D3ZSN8_9ROSI|nr:hypothetical protein J1N35_029016 [Gossypium stocksii]